MLLRDLTSNYSNNLDLSFRTIQRLRILQRIGGVLPGIVNFGNEIMTGHGVESTVNPYNSESSVVQHRNINGAWLDIKEAKAEFGIETDVDVVLLRYLDQAVKIIDQYLEKLKADNKYKLLILSRKLKIKQYSLDELTRKIEAFFIKKYPEEKNKIKSLFNEQIDEKGIRIDK